MKVSHNNNNNNMMPIGSTTIHQENMAYQWMNMNNQPTIMPLSVPLQQQSAFLFPIMNNNNITFINPYQAQFPMATSIPVANYTQPEFTKRRRRVRFQLPINESNSTNNNDNMAIDSPISQQGERTTTTEEEEDDLRSRWWQKEEYETSKSLAKAECRRLRRMGVFKGCLTNSYRLSCEVGDLQGDEVDELDDALVADAPLVRWCRASETPRGLERWSSKVHGHLRSQHVSDAKHAILLEQARQFLVNQQDPERLGRAARAATKRSRAFARLLGKADAIAVGAAPSTSTQNQCKRKRVDSFDQHCDDIAQLSLVSERPQKIVRTSSVSSESSHEEDDA